MDIVSSSLTAISLLLTPLETCCFYSRNFEKRVRTLRCDMEELVTKQNDLKAEINNGIVNQRKKLKSEIQLWLKNVEKLVTEVQGIETEIERCMKGCILNYRSRYRLSKIMVKRINELRELHAKGVFSNGLFVDSLSDSGRILPTTGLVGDKTFHRVSKAIWKLLTDVNTSKIGVHGMGGVGKTSIMMHIYNKLIDSKIFDRVIWVNVSKPFNVEKLQIDVANATNLEVSENENVVWRSTRLLEHLQGKKFVLILDDMWQKFSLEEVGIPQPSIDNGCKLVTVTRLMEVCRGMETQTEIKVELLSKNESWDLFTSKSGQIQSDEIEPIAKAVCDNCGGLPLAIITVGRAMRKIHDKRLWKNALEELQSSRAEIVGMEEDVFARLKFSYLHLKDEHIQACFLYSAVYPEGHKIEAAELIEYWMAEELITEVGDREKEINKGYTVLEKLKDACLLEDVGSDYVKMHDLVRDMAIRIAREGPRLVNKSAMKINRLASEWIENVEWVSVMDNSIIAVPDYPNCQKLSTLLLQRNPLSEKIPDSFFAQMQCLKVLDLSKTCIQSLPESVSALCNLRTLLLSFTQLKELPSLTKLKELRVLDLSHSILRRLPHDIEKLTNLRRLDLSYTEKLKAFPSGVIQKLSYLENFSMFRSKWKWSSNRGVGFDEISSLSKLTSLGLSFEDRTSFIDYVRSKHWQNLQSYHLGIGMLSIFLPISKGTRSIEIQGYDLVYQETVIELPDNIQQLAFHSCHDITSLSKLTDKTNMENLAQCYLSNCNGMEFITTTNNCFPNLELLVLRKLPKLKAISNGIAASQIFTKLKSLQIHSCNNIKYLFSTGMLQEFQNLEEIEIWNSNLIEEVVENQTLGNIAISSTVSLPKLRRLSLSTLPEMKCITRKVLICNHLETVDIWDCHKLRALPFSTSYLPFSLKHIKGNRSWWDRLEWDDVSCKNFLQPYFDQGT
uniref:disease resistance protein At4g27190-like n=1 Tax=Erigeron canadensis TaxID=72917 RepID=UPI001CB8C7AF|nr:disease resistance protein At4g27190-like [Erigeron canadensis]